MLHLSKVFRLSQALKSKVQCISQDKNSAALRDRTRRRRSGYGVGGCGLAEPLGAKCLGHPLSAKCLTHPLGANGLGHQVSAKCQGHQVSPKCLGRL